MGRPTLLTPELSAKICELVKAGVPYKTAAGANGIAYETFNSWRRKGRDALALASEHERAVDPESVAYVQFLHDVHLAREEGMAALLVLWRRAAAEDWRAARALLAVYDPALYAQRAQVSVSGGAGEELPDERGAAVEETVPADVERAALVLGLVSDLGLLDDD